MKVILKLSKPDGTEIGTRTRANVRDAYREAYQVRSRVGCFVDVILVTVGKDKTLLKLPEWRQK